MAVIQKNKDHWIFFFLFPFIAFITAIRRYRAPWARNVSWAFIVFFGFTLGLSKELSSGEETADITRYSSEMKVYNKMNLSFTDIVKLYEDNDDFDILRLTLAIVISRFTDSEQILFAVYGLIFGFFFSRNLWYLFDGIKNKLKSSTIILLSVFFLINPFWNINGFRFWTAVHIYVYGLLPFLMEGKKNKLWVSALSIFVHFSFMLPLGILGIYLILKNKTIIYFVFFIFSIFVSGINVKIFNEAVEENISENIAERTAAYRDEDNVEEFRLGTSETNKQPNSWHARFYTGALHYSLLICMVWLFFKRSILKKIDPGLLSTLSFSLLFWGVGNIMSSLPSGGRFLNIAYLSATSLVIFCLQKTERGSSIDKMARLLSPAFLFYAIVAFRVGLYFISVNTIIGNPILIFFTDYNFSLNDLIK